MQIKLSKQDAIYVFIQARFGSIRLPGKVMKPLLNKNLLSWSVERALKIHPLAQVVVLTGDTEDNTPIIDWCNDNNILLFQGSEGDVLNRFRKATDTFKANTVIRLTADNPLFDYVTARALLAVHLIEKADYSCNKSEIGSGMPDGIGVEIFSASILHRLDDMTLSNSHREHINDYILENPNQFTKCFWLKLPTDYSKYSFTIDTSEDYNRVLSWITKYDNHQDSDYWRKIVINED